jgi:8-amino-3,8-dideoxy-alpha-D-manno-octulosonate transaminase
MKSKNWRLAVDGAEPTVKTKLPPSILGGLRIGEEEEEAVLNVLRNKRLFRYYGAIGGVESQVDNFEKLLIASLGVKYALGVNSGTSALSCAMTAMGIGPGDEVIIPAYAWVSSAASVVRVGAVPILADVDDTFCLDPKDLEEKRSQYTKLIMPVHMCGASCDMDSIINFAKQFDLMVLEDAAQALGASYKGVPLGGLGDAGILSFQWNKMITSGEGGAVVTNSQKIYERSLLCHDVLGAFRVNGLQHDEIPFGNSYRMSEIQGAILNVQMRRIESIRSDLRTHKRLLLEQIDPVLEKNGIKHRRYNDPTGETATDIFLTFQEQDIERIPFIAKALFHERVPVNTFFNDLHVFNTWVPLFFKTTWTKNGGPWLHHPREVNYSPTMCPKTLQLMSSTIKIPLSPDMSVEQREQVGLAITKVLDVAL